MNVSSASARTHVRASVRQCVGESSGALLDLPGNFARYDSASTFESLAGFTVCALAVWKEQLKAKRDRENARRRALYVLRPRPPRPARPAVVFGPAPCPPPPLPAPALQPADQDNDTTDDEEMVGDFLLRGDMGAKRQRARLERRTARTRMGTRLARWRWSRPRESDWLRALRSAGQSVAEQAVIRCSMFGASSRGLLNLSFLALWVHPC